MHLLFGNIMKKIVIEIQFFYSDCICNLSTKVLEELDLLIIALAAQKDTQVRQRWEESFCSKIKKSFVKTFLSSLLTRKDLERFCTFPVRTERTDFHYCRLCGMMESENFQILGIGESNMIMGRAVSQVKSTLNCHASTWDCHLSAKSIVLPWMHPLPRRFM